MSDAEITTPAATPGDARSGAHRVDWLVIASLGVLSLIFVGEALLALGWKIEHDAPLMLYVAYLIDQLDFVPYRDIYDFNLPGTYLFNILLLRVFGIGDVAFRVADLLVFAAIVLLNGLWLRRFGALTIWAAAALFGLVYFHFGPLVTMQREYITLLPIGAALAVAFQLSERRPRTAQFVVGLIFGIVATIKPHLAVGVPLVVIYQLHGDYRPRAWIRAGLWSVGGFAIPIGGMLAYIAAVGAWRPFWEIVREYWPLYGRLGSDLAADDTWTWLRYYLSGFNNFVGLGLLLVPATIGAGVALRQSGTGTKRRFVVLLAALAIVYAIYTTFAGRFWAYHWLPFYFFVSLLAALCFGRVAQHASRVERRTLALTAFFCFLIAAHPHLAELPRALTPEDDARQRRVAQIAQFLEQNLRAGDTVQPLDWTGGAVQAMLAARARIATPYMYDFYFYHDVSTPYIQGLRTRFVEALRRAQPRYVIQMTARTWPRARDVSKEFPALEQYIRQAYHPARSGAGYVIWERR